MTSYFITDSPAASGPAGGDLSGTFPNPIVNSIQGVVITGTPAAGNVLEATSPTAASWVGPSGGVTLSGDATGPANSNTVVKLQGNPLQSVSLGALQDGYVLTWKNGASLLEFVPSNDTISLSGDVTGPANANIVGRLNGGSSGLFALAITDFIAMGGATVAAAGLVRLPNNAGTIISQRNAGNTGDLPLFATADTNGNFNIGSINSTVAGISTIYAPNTLQIRGTSVTAGQPFIEIASATYLLFQSATGGTLGTGGGFRFTNNAGVDYGLTISTIYNGATGIGFGESVTSATISQATSLNTSCAQMLIQAQSSAIAASGGGNLILASGVGTGLDGYISLEVGQTQVAQFQLSTTDFIKMGGSVPAATGLLRLSNNPGTIIAQRNAANNGDLAILSTPNTTDLTVGGGIAGNILIGSASFNMQMNVSGGLVQLQSAAGTFAGTNGIQFSDLLSNSAAIGFVPSHAGASYISFGPKVTSANIAQVINTGTGTNAGSTFTIQAQQGQLQTGATNNNNGGNLVLSGGIAGTGGSGAAGLTGNVNIVVDGYTQASFTPMGIQYAISTIPLNTSGTYFMEQNELACPNIVFTGTLAGAITIAFGGVVGEWSLDFSQLTYGVNAVTITNGAGTYTATTILGTKKLLTVVCNTTSTVACG